MVHIELQVVGRKVTARRDNGAEQSMELTTPIRIAAQTRVVLWGMSPQMRVAKVAYRPIMPATQPVNQDEFWKKSRFAGQDDLTRQLTERVVPMLNAQTFRARQSAYDLLEKLWPLSRPAVQAAIKQGNLPPEATVRLTSLVEFVPQLVVAGRPADEPPPTTQVSVPEFKPTSQPEGNARVRIQGGAMRFQVQGGAMQILPANEPPPTTQASTPKLKPASQPERNVRVRVNGAVQIKRAPVQVEAVEE